MDNLIDWNVFAPRIGLTHDLAGDGKTIAKLIYGQYWLAPGTDLGFNANPNSNQWWRRYTWTDLDGSGVWERGEESRPCGTAAVASRSNPWTRHSNFRFSERSLPGSSASCSRILPCGQGWCGEVSDSTTCART